MMNWFGSVFKGVLIAFTAVGCERIEREAVSVPQQATEVKVSATGGFSSADATAAAQQALDSGMRKVVFDRAGSPYIVRPLFVRSNTEVVFEEGVELIAKKGEFRGLWDALVTVHGATNVVLRGLGKGATLRMQIKDYQSAEYKRGEWRHAVNILSASNVTLENLVLANSGGDGIYLGAKPTSVPCREIVIRDCICDNNNRQGISVISVDGLLIERTVMKNTRGTAPRSGIDFEPNSAGQLLKRIVMRDCLAENNYGAGYELFVNHPDRRTAPFDITLENCRASGNRGAALKIAYGPAGREKRGFPPGGRFLLKNCMLCDTRGSAVYIGNKPRGVLDVVFDNCTIDHGSSRAEADIRFVNDDRYLPPTDGVEMKNLRIIRPKAENWFAASPMPWSNVGMDAVCGSVEIVSGGKSRRVVLDETWRRSVFPRGGEKYILDKVAFDPANVKRVVDSAPGKSVRLSPVTLRFALNALVYAAKPGPVRFASRFVKVARTAPKELKFKVKDMTGKTVAEWSSPVSSETSHEFTAPAAGFYKLECNLHRSGIRLVSSDAPIGVMPIPVYGLDVYKSNAALYLAHAAGVDETFFCGGTGEAVNIALFDPSGAEAGEWKNQRFWGFKRLGPDAGEGLWKIEVSAPSAGSWEDSCYDRTGAPNVFFLTDKKYWISR